VAQERDEHKGIEQILDDRGIGEGDRASLLKKEELLATKLDDDFGFVYEKLKSTKIAEIVRYFQAFMTFKPDDEILDASKSNLLIPKPFEIVRGGKAQLSAVVAGRQRPYGRAVGRRPQDRGASAVSWTIDWQLQQNQWDYLIQEILTNTLCYGSQPIQVSWDRAFAYNFKTEPIYIQISPELPPVPMGEKLATRNGEPVYEGLHSQRALNDECRRLNDE